MVLGGRRCGIDIKSTVGRLYQGDTARVTFLQCTAEDVAQHEPASFDLVVLCDVLHHVLSPERPSLLSAIRRAMVPGGSLAVGDDVEFFTPQSMQALLIGAFGPDAVRGKALVRPWSNNIAYHIRR